MTNQICVKCKTEKAEIFIKAALCSNCFQTAIQTRIRTNIGKAQLPMGARMLIAFSGGPSSVALLYAMHHMLQGVKNNANFMHERFASVTVCHVDQSAVLKHAEDSIGSIRSIMDAYPDYELDIVGLESAIAMDSQGTTLKEWFDKLQTPDAKIDALQSLTIQTLLVHARRLQCHAIMFGDNSSEIAIRVLSQTSKGRGIAIPTLVSDSSWHQDVFVCRPLRDTLRQEIDAFNSLSGIKSVDLPCLSETLPAKSSIERITRDFLKGLQTDFPFTACTVSRTACKINTDLDSKRVCPICQGPTDIQPYGVCRGCTRLQLDPEAALPQFMKDFQS